MRYLRIVTLMLLAILAGSTASAFAFGHGGAKVETEGGIPLAPLKHDQVPALYQHFDAILKAAHTAANNQAWRGPEREEFIDVLTFTRNTYGNAWWGYAPGDVLNSDANPWHLPTHAYLRGAYELLERMRKADPSSPAVNQLYDTVNNAMYGLMGTCYYSNTPFSTLDDVRPDWSRADITPYAQVGLAFLVFFSALISLLFATRYQRPAFSYLPQARKA